MTREQRRNVLRNEIGDVLVQLQRIAAWADKRQRRGRVSRRLLFRSLAAFAHSATTACSKLLDLFDDEDGGAF